MTEPRDPFAASTPPVASDPQQFPIPPAMSMGPPTARTTTEQDTPAKILAVFIAVITGGIFIPGAIATYRNTDNQALVWWLCVLTWWTVIGWLVALVIAAQRTQKHRLATRPDWPSRHPVLLAGSIGVALLWLVIVTAVL